MFSLPRDRDPKVLVQQTNAHHIVATQCICEDFVPITNRKQEAEVLREKEVFLWFLSFVEHSGQNNGVKFLFGGCQKLFAFALQTLILQTCISVSQWMSSTCSTTT